MSTMSPELALPRVRPYAFLERSPHALLEQPAAAEPGFRASAALAYLLVAVARTVAFDAVVFASVAVCVLLANVFG
jgi:hypothetical protein